MNANTTFSEHAHVILVKDVGNLHNLTAISKSTTVSAPRYSIAHHKLKRGCDYELVDAKPVNGHYVKSTRSQPCVSTLYVCDEAHLSKFNLRYHEGEYVFTARPDDKRKRKAPVRLPTVMHDRSIGATSMSADMIAAIDAAVLPICTGGNREQMSFTLSAIKENVMSRMELYPEVLYKWSVYVNTDTYQVLLNPIVHEVVHSIGADALLTGVWVDKSGWVSTHMRGIERGGEHEQSACGIFQPGVARLMCTRIGSGLVHAETNFHARSNQNCLASDGELRVFTPAQFLQSIVDWKACAVEAIGVTLDPIQRLLSERGHPVAHGSPDSTQCAEIVRAKFDCDEMRIHDLECRLADKDARVFDQTKHHHTLMDQIDVYVADIERKRQDHAKAVHTVHTIRDVASAACVEKERAEQALATAKTQSHLHVQLIDAGRLAYENAVKLAESEAKRAESEAKRAESEAKRAESEAKRADMAVEMVAIVKRQRMNPGNNEHQEALVVDEFASSSVPDAPTAAVKSTNRQKTATKCAVKCQNIRSMFAK